MSIQSYYFKVKPELQEYVEFVAYFESAKSYFPDRLIPSTHVHLFVSAASPITIFPNCDRQQPVPIPTGWLKSLHEKPYGVELGDYTRTVSILFKPCTAYSLMLQPMNLLSNRILPAEQITIPDFSSLHSEFKKITDPEKVENLVNDYLLTHLNKGAFDQPRVFRALEATKSLKSNATLPVLAKKAGVSTKHLKTLFDKYIGLSPKKFGCIMRFNELLPLIAYQEFDDWMTIVANFGYHDQSHFIKDFKRFTGLTPTEFLEEYIFIDNLIFRKDANLQ